MKLFRVPGTRQMGLGSAWWQVVEQPGLVIYKDRAEKVSCRAGGLAICIK